MDLQFIELETRPCTLDDFFSETSDQTEYGFFQADSTALFLQENESYSNFKCIVDPYQVYGNYNTVSLENLMVVYELCSREERTTCKSDQEISDAI